MIYKKKNLLTRALRGHQNAHKRERQTARRAQYRCDCRLLAAASASRSQVAKASSGSVEGFIGIGFTAKFRPQAATTYYPSSTRPGLRLPS